MPSSTPPPSIRAADYLAWAWKVHRARKAVRAYDAPGPIFAKWWIGYFRDGMPIDRCEYEHIVLSLCFMAAMVRAGDA